MKKYISILILALFIIPSIAFASWWNPFTWKIFKKREPAPQVQVINTEKEKTSEEKIVELQKQLDELKTQKTTNEPTKETITTKDVKKTTPAVNNTFNNIQSENFNNKSIISAQGVLIKMKALETGIDNGIEDINERISLIKKISDLEKSTTQPSGLSDAYYSLSKEFIRILDLEVELMKIDIEKLNKGRNVLFKYHSDLNKIIDNYPTQIITKEQSIKDIKYHNEIVQLLEVGNTSINAIIDLYNKRASEYNKDYQKILDAFISYLNKTSYKQETITNYTIPTPVYIQPIKIPQSTRCYVQGYGNTGVIDCYSN